MNFHNLVRCTKETFIANTNQIKHIHSKRQTEMEEKQRYGAVCAEAKGINIKYRHDNKPLLSTIFIIQCEFNIMYA